MLVFFPHIGRLLDKVVSIQIGDKQIYFSRELEDTLGAALQQAEKADLPERDRDVFAHAIHDKALRSIRKAQELGDDRPRDAIIESWTGVQRALDACERLNLAQSYGGLRTFRETSDLLRTNGHLDADLLGLLHHLRHVRNEAAHAIQFKISPDAAKRYIDLCLGIIRYLQPLGQKA